MRLRLFSGPSGTAALREVKRELGEDALILSTRELTGGGVEITAATDVDRVDRPLSDPPPAAAAVRPPEDSGPEILHDMLRGMGAQLRRLERRLPAAAAPIGEIENWERLEPEARQLGELLVSHGLHATGAAQVAANFQAQRAAGTPFDDAVARAIVDWLPTAHLRALPNVRFLVGPTGSGKTTTIAKLAAENVLANGPRPLLLNADCMRIGAGEQLAGVARLLDLEVATVKDAQDLTKRLDQEQMDRPIYVDTAGLSSDESILRGVRTMVDSCPGGGAVTAVVSATASRSALERAWQQMESLRPENCAVTHVDESDEPGTACSWLEGVGVPLRWLGTGQRIPQDLAEATGANLALWLVAA